jgi:hypothetical protein
MSMSQEDWDKMKANEQYGMYAALEKRIKKLEDRCDEHMQYGDYCPHTQC